MATGHAQTHTLATSAMPKQKTPSPRFRLIAAAGIIAIAIIAFLVNTQRDHNQKPIAPDEQWAPQPPANVGTAEQVFTPETIEAIDEVATQPAAPGPEPAPRVDPCARTKEEITAFFSALENKPYVKAYELGEPLIDHIGTLVIKLLNNPPVVADETGDLLTVLKNTAHFYRILGPKDLSLIKDILANEYNDLEYIWARIYRWQEIAPECESTSLTLRFPLKKTYEYAAFFLNTLGGQSYLFRRDSHIRVLTRYYCLLFLAQADKAGLNRYGIDLADTLRSVADDIRNADSLEYQEDYLKTLAALSATPK